MPRCPTCLRVPQAAPLSCWMSLARAHALQMVSAYWRHCCSTMRPSPARLCCWHAHTSARCWTQASAATYHVGSAGWLSLFSTSHVCHSAQHRPAVTLPFLGGGVPGRASSFVVVPSLATNHFHTAYHFHAGCYSAPSLHAGDSMLPRTPLLSLCTMQVLVGGGSSGAGAAAGGQRVQQGQGGVGDAEQEHVFLYKLVPGVVASSYGVSCSCSTHGTKQLMSQSCLFPVI